MNLSMHRFLCASFFALSFACAKQQESTPPDPLPQEPPATQAQVVETPTITEAKGDTQGHLALILASEHRSPTDRARDQFRHPAETLQFFEVEENSVVVELWAGGGWYTDILAPLVREKGKLYAVNFAADGDPNFYATNVGKKFQEKLASNPKLFDRVDVVPIVQEVELDDKGSLKSMKIKEFRFAPPGSADVVLTFRNSHTWFEHQQQEAVYRMAFQALKPGGILGVVQHRAAEGSDPKATAPKGYLPESAVIAAAESVGFELVEKTEINANPKDTKDYASGVWALPPRLKDGDKDREKYLAIGESDRMTLKFRKPVPPAASTETAPQK